MKRFKALVGLNMFCDIGSTRLKKLLDTFVSPEEVLKAKAPSVKEADIDAELRSAEQQKIRILAIDDPAYPANLKYIPDPPIVLYAKGELEDEDRLSIAIVGSRRASLYGVSSAEKFAGELSGRGFTIVSGLARGIDTAAHQGALKAGGRTIAVIGSGFNHMYPPENEKLADEIAGHGAVISEFPMDARPLPHNFPRRNRVISGLSLGLLVVEAARNSGALITVDCALEQGRDVFALPGKIDSDTSFGTNEIIKQGAKLVSCADDIADEFGLAKVAPKHEVKAEVSDEESALYDLIRDEPVTLDEITERTGLDITRISDILLNLQLRRLVREVPGKQFIRMNA